MIDGRKLVGWGWMFNHIITLVQTCKGLLNGWVCLLNVLHLQLQFYFIFNIIIYLECFI